MSVPPCRDPPVLGTPGLTPRAGCCWNGAFPLLCPPGTPPGAETPGDSGARPSPGSQGAREPPFHSPEWPQCAHGGRCAATTCSVPHPFLVLGATPPLSIPGPPGQGTRLCRRRTGVYSAGVLSVPQFPQHGKMLLAVGRKLLLFLLVQTALLSQCRRKQLELPHSGSFLGAWRG